jgi:hypothetical protein
MSATPSSSATDDVPAIYRGLTEVREFRECPSKAGGLGRRHRVRRDRDEVM